MIEEKNKAVEQELKECADVISGIDIRMQNLHNITLRSIKSQRG
jgi:ppGpp synthetase/RelA/SpoT-type nucleotidyltranferase